MRLFMRTALAAIGGVALFALAATPALAAKYEGTGSIKVIGNGAQTFTLEGATFTCRTLSGTGSYTPGGTTANFTPAYSKCEFGTGASLTNEGGCEYHFNEPKAGGVEWYASFDIRKEGCRLDWYGEFLGIGCHLYIGPQAGLTEVEAENLGGGELDVVANVRGIAYTDEGSGCRLIGIEHASGTNMEYAGQVEVENVEIK